MASANNSDNESEKLKPMINQANMLKRGMPHFDASSNKIERFVNWFIVSAGGVLLITGIAKVVSASGNARLLDISDPIFAISFRHMMLLVGLLELAVSAFCFLTSKRQLSLCLVGWLATSFLVYRSGLWFLNWNHPCSCLGNLTGAIHLSRELAETIAKVLSVYLLVGSIGSLLYMRRSLLRGGATISHENVQA